MRPPMPVVDRRLVEPRPPEQLKGQFSADVIATMRAEVLSGVSRNRLAKRYGTTYHGVYNHTHDLKVGGPSAQQINRREGMLARAKRQDRLFTACNRALAREARP